MPLERLIAELNSQKTDEATTNRTARNNLGISDLKIVFFLTFL